MATPNSDIPADGGASKKKGKAGAGFVLGRGSALFRSLVESAAAGPEADVDADLAARCVKHHSGRHPAVPLKPAARIC